MLALDRAVSEVSARALDFARLSVAKKAQLLRALIARTRATAAAWARAGCLNKGLDPDAAEAAEEWLTGPYLVLRNLRLYADSLESIARHGKPPLGTGVRRREDGRVEVQVFPADSLDKALFLGYRADVVLERGVTEEQARATQASLYASAEAKGGVTVILGAGNVSSIPPTDVLFKLFAEGRVCILKMNPVNEWLGPILEEAFAPLVAAGYLRICTGGGDVGRYLVEHAQVDDVHITGSDKTHDLIVWGPPGAERERRRAANDPLLRKSISSELGNVTPVILVSSSWSAAELDVQARNVAAMVTNNASFNCIAGKMLVTSRAWPQREVFLQRLGEHLAKTPLRKAYYPGAADRYDALTAGRAGLRCFGERSADALPWTVIPDLDARASSETLFQTEPFCGILSEVALDAADPMAYLAAATTFCNERLWGTLSASVVIHPALERDRAVAKALGQAVNDLRYGTVAINHWAGMAFGLMSTPWGAYPGATLADVQSGRGFVHNSFFLERIEKCVVRGPFKPFPTPPWFGGHKTALELGKKLVELEAAPSLMKVPAIAMAAARG